MGGGASLKGASMATKKRKAPKRKSTRRAPRKANGQFKKRK